LVAKFRIDNAAEFWTGVGNSRLSASTLFPDDDPIKYIVDTIRKKHLEA